MKRKFKIIILILSVLSTPALAANAALINEMANKTDPAKYFYKHLKGTINRKIPITMDLIVEYDEIYGSYYYSDKGVPIIFKGKIDSYNKITFQTNDKKTSCSFVADFTGSALNGTWCYKDKQTPYQFELSEDYSKKSLMFKMISGSSTTPMVSGIKNSPLYVYKQSILAANNNSYQDIDNKINDEIYKMNFDDNAKNSFIPSKPSNNADCLYSWNRTSKMMILYNENGWLSLLLSSQDSAEGIESTSSSIYKVFDTSTGADLALADIFKPDFERKLYAIIIKENRWIRKTDFYIKKDSSFYITGTGIGISYQSDPTKNEIKVFVPFNKIAAILKPGIYKVPSVEKPVAKIKKKTKPKAKKPLKR